MPLCFSEESAVFSAYTVQLSSEGIAGKTVRSEKVSESAFLEKDS